MIVSAYLYHKRGAEAGWTKLSFDNSTYMNTNRSCARFAWPARAARAVADSYFSYLQSVPFAIGVLQVADDMLETDIKEAVDVEIALASTRSFTLRMEDYTSSFSDTMAQLLEFIGDADVPEMLEKIDKYNLATHPVQALQENGISHVSTESTEMKASLRAVIAGNPRRCRLVQHAQILLGYDKMLCSHS